MAGFLKNLLLLSGSLTLIVTGLNMAHFYKPYFSFSLLSLLFFVTVSVIVFYIMLMGISDRQKSRFMGYFGLGLGFKFIAALAFFTIVVRLQPEWSEKIFIPFMILYMIYTVFISFEVISRLTLFKDS